MRAMVWFSSRAVSSAGARRIGTGRLGDRPGDSYRDPEAPSPGRTPTGYGDAWPMTGKPISNDSPAARGGPACALGFLGVQGIVVDLDGRAPQLAAGLRAELEAQQGLGRSARLGGPSLALASYAAAGEGLPEPAWVLSVGGAVRRGLPTAARGTLTARTRLRPGVVEAQFGGTFGASFSAHLDGLFVYGKSERPVVLECFGEAGQGAPLVRVVPAPSGLLGQGLSERERALRAAFGLDIAILAVGPAADLGLGIANVASLSGGPDGASGGTPSFVGRGGMGLALRETGVVAVVVHGRAGAEGLPESPESQELRGRLLSSPRLLARDVGGTLELGALRGQASGEQPAPHPPHVPSTSAATKHGCRGCPTPCGWTFDQPKGSDDAAPGPSGFQRTGGRFAALQGAIGEGEGGMPFLADCNELGVDARSAALVMGTVRRAGLGFDGPRDFMDEGSAAFREVTLLRSDSDVEPAPSHHGADLAAQVGVLCSARGPEPVRSLSVLGFGSVEPRAVVAPLPWSGDAEWDAGVLAYWHECFAAAIDISGFCAFSAAGLVADGVLGVGELARQLAPGGGWGEGDAPGFAMLTAGAEHVERHRSLTRVPSTHASWGDVDGAEAPVSEGLARALGGYAAARAHGFRAGATSPSVDPSHTESGPAELTPKTAPQESGAGRDAPGPGSVRLRMSGLLAARLGSGGEPDGHGATELEWPLPHKGADLAALIGSLAGARPALGPWLLARDGRLIPAAVSGGKRLGPGATVVPGAEIELILAIPGG